MNIAHRSAGVRAKMSMARQLSSAGFAWLVDFFTFDFIPFVIRNLQEERKRERKMKHLHLYNETATTLNYICLQIAKII
jgi:hypothetical protein